MSSAIASYFPVQVVFQSCACQSSYTSCFSYVDLAKLKVKCVYGHHQANCWDFSNFIGKLGLYNQTSCTYGAHLEPHLGLWLFPPHFPWLKIHNTFLCVLGLKKKKKEDRRKAWNGETKKSEAKTAFFWCFSQYLSHSLHFLGKELQSRRCCWPVSTWAKWTAPAWK